MTEWWTYTLSDFLLFSPKTYFRLFELYNRAIWPAQIAAVLAGLSIGLLLLPGSVRRGRILSATLAACWLWVAVVFHARYYRSVNTAAVYFAWAFALEAALLIATTTIPGRLTREPWGGISSRVGTGLFLFALLVQPLVGPLLGHSWRGIEIFGVTPDPTCVATLGLLLRVRGAAGWTAAAVPTIWCAISGAMLLAMKSPGAAVPFLAVLLATGARMAGRSPRADRVF